MKIVVYECKYHLDFNGLKRYVYTNVEISGVATLLIITITEDI